MARLESWTVTQPELQGKHSLTHRQQCERKVPQSETGMPATEKSLWVALEEGLAIISCACSPFLRSYNLPC